MNKQFSFLLFTVFSFCLNGQNIQITGIEKIYYYKTVDDFFSGKKDSLTGDNLEYDYGVVSYIDKKSKKKIKFHLKKDSSIFAFKLAGKNKPIYAIGKGEKRYGVFAGGNKNLMCIFYSRGNFNYASYDNQNYLVSYSGTVDEFGYYLGFVKSNYESKKNGDIEYFIKDNSQLYNQYLNERTNSTTYYWNKNFILKQVEYMKLYNNN